MKLRNILVGIVIVLVIGEALALLAADTMPLSVAKPYRTVQMAGHGPRYRFFNDRGNQANLYRGEKHRLGIFGNSFAMSESRQTALWPYLLQTHFPGVHVENYSARGANFTALHALLNLARERGERFDATVIVLNLSTGSGIAKMPLDEDAFQYSNVRRACAGEDSCLYKRLSDIYDRQLKSDPFLGKIAGVVKSAGIDSASAETPNMKFVRQKFEAELAKSKCLADNMGDCRRVYQEGLDRRMLETKSKSLSFDEKMTVYETDFLSCQKQKDEFCGVERNPERIKFSPANPANFQSAREQIEILHRVASEISDRVFLVVSPFAFNPANDPINLVNCVHAEINRTVNHQVFYQDADMIEKLRQGDFILRHAITQLGFGHIEIQKPLDEMAVHPEAVFTDIGHVTELGHVIVAREIAKALEEAQVFSPEVR